MPGGPASAAGRPDLVVGPSGGAIARWFVFGPARLHYTLARSVIISKAAAGEYLAQLFPGYADLAHRAVRWRTGEAERFTATDLVAAGDSVNVVADDAWRRIGN
ncbi:hypothetical protein OG777_08335 [Micromonospora peucetia]|uniref:hypothetical protein n=1 Tax=Micromonospora peucetia TaxID=47871 RepID=UPI002250EF0B|nr:hypothetical protein [Micromonospora peucetia]MCX4386935.1 hypothetical protein [Micromonospora peucetia]